MNVPAPVSVNRDFTVDIGTAGTALSSAFLPSELRMGLSLLGTNDPGRCTRSEKRHDDLHCVPRYVLT